MSDRTSAELVGRVMRLLDKYNEHDLIGKYLIPDMWEEIGSGGDFMPYQCEIDDLIVKYQLEEDWEEYTPEAKARYGL